MGTTTLRTIGISANSPFRGAITPLWGQASLPHWSMSAWLFLIPVMGEQLERAASGHRWPRTWAVASLSLLLSVWGLLIVCGATGLVGATWPRTFAKGDPTLELLSWDQLAPTQQVTALLRGRAAFTREHTV